MALDKRRIGRRILITVVAGSLIVTPAMAAPSVDKLKENKAAKQNEVNSLQQELTDIMTKLGVLEEDLIKKGEEITQAEEDLVSAEKKEKEQYEAMKLRIKYMYEEGNSTAIETLVSAKNFTDLVNKAEYVQNVHKYDREQLNEYVETKQEISDLKTSLEEDQKAMMSLQTEYEEKETELSTTIETKRAEVADLDVQIQAAAEAAAREAEERRRREEEERRTREEAANRNRNNGNTENSTANDNGNNGNIGIGIADSTSNDGNTNTSADNGNANAPVDNGNTDTSANTNNNNETANNNNSTAADNNSAPSTGGADTGNTSAAQAIVSAAYSQLGVPYVWGGSMPGQGLDCSGLVQYCHSVAGISVGRTSQVQGGGGKAVSNPQPGDVVCYGSHVGIYLGNGQMIHAPRTGDVVRVASVYGSPWYRRYW